MKTMKKIFALLLCLLTLLPLLALFPASAEEVERRMTPIMGWASWNAYRTDISEGSILSQAEKLKELGLADLGYIYVNVDDGWQNGRGEDGLVAVNTVRFPSGMKDLSDKIHQMGLKVGIYTDAGASTCGWESDNQVNNDNVGLYGHDDEDLRHYFIDWDYDFVKVDWCGGRQLGLSQQTRYTAIGKVVDQIEAETGKDRIYNVCCWSFPGAWVVDAADSWRTGGDINNTFSSVLEQIDNIKSLAGYNGPGHVNDLDMMQIGNGMTYEEDKSHFSMWCMMSTPLMLGMDLNSISDETLSIVSNAELIALDQDPACVQATVARSYGNVEAWVKDLQTKDSDTKAFALLNRGGKEATVTVNFEDLGLAGVSSVRDLWAHTDISVDGTYRVTVPAHGTVVLKASGKNVGVAAPTDVPTEDDGSKVEGGMTVDAKPARINLTNLGKYDWAHFGANTVRMKNGACEIGLACSGSFCTYDNAAATYSWTNGEGQARANGDKSGLGAIGGDASITVSTPCDKNERTLCVAVGSYSASMKLEMIVGGKVISETELAGGRETKVDKLVTMTYKSDIPTTAYLRVSVTKDLGNSESVNVEGVYLNVDASENAIGTVRSEVGTGKLTLSVPVLLAEDEATLYIAPEDADGCPVAVTTYPVTKGAQSKNVTLDLPLEYAGSIGFYLWKDGLPLCDAAFISANLSSVNNYSIGMMTAKSLLSRGALLVDVRSAEEYEKEHLEGALHLDYLEVADKAAEVLPDKDRALIVYCSAAKRSAQATAELLKLGYTAVYNLGSMQNFRAEPMITFAGTTCTVLTAGEKVNVNYTADRYDTPEVYISVGSDSTFADALPLPEFTVPDYDGYYLTLKAYLAYGGVCYAETSKRFIYWSEKTVDTFATDLAWSKSTVGWGTIHKNRSVENNDLKLAGKKFAHGIGTHATSEIEMAVPEGAVKFLAVAGCDEEKLGEYTTMMFMVCVDGELVDESSLLKCGQHYVFDVDLPAGAEKILLYAYEGTAGGNSCDHADWAVAGFFTEAKAN